LNVFDELILIILHFRRNSMMPHWAESLPSTSQSVCMSWLVALLQLLLDVLYHCSQSCLVKSMG
jgi:hypothetical protein